MVVIESLGLMLQGAVDLFKFNRSAYQFDSRQEQERLYHLQKMRNTQGVLYRQDVRDLFGLTITKMESYLIVATLTSLLTLVLVYEGNVPASTPAWLFLLWAASSTAAICFLLLSQWFAVHASVAGQVGRAESLVRHIRLPVPTLSEISVPARLLEDFEYSESSLRIPFVDKAVAEPVESPESLGSPFRLFLEKQKEWMGYDAYARVSLILGTNQLLLALSYTGIAYFAAEAGIHVYWAFMAVLASFAIAHAHMNMLVRFRVFVTYAVLYFLAPTLACTTYAVYPRAPFTAGFYILSTGAIASQFLALGFFAALALRVEENYLPTRFATVQQIDVLGLLGVMGSQREVAPSVAIPAAPVVCRGVVEHVGDVKSDAYCSFKILAAVNLLILLVGLVMQLLSGFTSITGWSNSPEFVKTSSH